MLTNFTTMCPLQVHKKYDLKGSTVDREASDKEKQKKEPTLKDMDFLNDGAKVKIGDEAKEKLLETLSADVEFLTKNDIMDYSLLLGIHDTKQAVEDDREAEEEEDEEDEEYDSGGSGVALTPPESPGLRALCILSLRCLQTTNYDFVVLKWIYLPQVPGGGSCRRRDLLRTG